MVGSGPHQTSPHQAKSANVVSKMSFSILNVKEIVKTIKKAMCIPSTRMEAIFEGKETYPMRETIIKPCNKRLMIWRSNSVEHNRNDPLPALMSPSMMNKDTIYKQRSRTPPSESFSCEEEHLHQRKRRSPSHREVETDVMKKALS